MALDLRRRCQCCGVYGESIFSSDIIIAPGVLAPCSGFQGRVDVSLQCCIMCESSLVRVFTKSAQRRLRVCRSLVGDDMYAVWVLVWRVCVCVCVCVCVSVCVLVC